MRLLTLLSALPFFAAAQFTPDAIGHVSDPKFRDFLHANNIQLCGAFTVQHSLDPTIHFATIFKEDKLMFLESKGKIYETYPEYIKATGMEESISKMFDEMKNPFEEREEMEDDVDFPDWFDEDRTYSYEKRGKIGYVFNNKKILPPVYDYIRMSQAGREPVFIITRNGLEGIADSTGKIIVEPAYDRISGLFGTDRICYHVKDGEREGFLDKAGNISIAFQDLRMTYHGNYILIAKTGYFDGGFSAADRLYGIMDTTGKILIEPTYQYMNPVSDYSGEKTVHYDAILVETPSLKTGIVNFSGKLLLDTLYKDIDRFYGNIYRFTTGKHFAEEPVSGLFDVAAGKVILPADYIFGSDYSDENDTLVFRKAERGSLQGLITKKGEVLVPDTYPSVQLLKTQQLLILQKENGYMLTDLRLRPVLATVYDRLYPLKDPEIAGKLPENLLLAKKNGKEGVIDVNGKVIIPLQYTSILPENYVLSATRDEKRLFLDLQGNILYSTDRNVIDSKIGYVMTKDPSGNYELADLYGNTLKNKKIPSSGW